MNFNQIIKYFNYKLFSKHKNGHSIHSPFIFDLIVNVFLDKTQYSPYKQIEAHRKTLLNSKQLIQINDLGAGKSPVKSEKLVKEIAKKSLKNKKYSQVLFKIAKYYNSENILEIGTSFGITSLYFSLANSRSKIVTIEGCENIANIAKNTFSKFNINNIDLIVGNFDYVLPGIINNIDTLDIVFFDGNHKLKPTLTYFELCLKKVNENSIFIFDDIYWSKEMNKAWNIIKNDTRVSFTIDIFSLGLVFFNKNVEKQDFIIRY